MSDTATQDIDPRLEKKLLLAVGFITLSLLAVMVLRIAGDFRRENAAPEPVLLSVAPEEVIGERPDFLGSPNAPYTLVEFADYQCPPCRAIGTRLPSFLARFPGKVRLTFRNLPLAIHPQARSAAIAAEAAREQGRFWQMHDALYRQQNSLSAGVIQMEANRQGLDAQRFQQALTRTAPLAVAKDEYAAECLRIESTPTFFLCCPDKRIVKLGKLAQAESYL